MFILLCRLFKDEDNLIWRSKYDSSGKYQKGWFILGLEYRFPNNGKTKQITYHLPQKLWDKCSFAQELPKSRWNGHTKEDTLKNLIEILSYD
jgi:hypothetical protein